MSDAKLRELERRWRETGAVEDEAAYLKDRVRVGDLPCERVELAAVCRHEAARRVVATRSLTFEASFTQWIEAVERLGVWPVVVGAGLLGQELCRRFKVNAAPLDACSLLAASGDEQPAEFWAQVAALRPAIKDYACRLAEEEGRQSLRDISILDTGWRAWVNPEELSVGETVAWTCYDILELVLARREFGTLASSRDVLDEVDVELRRLNATDAVNEAVRALGVRALLLE